MEWNKSAPNASSTSGPARDAHADRESVAELRDSELWNQFNKAGVQFVLNELEMALTFLDIADSTSDVERRQRLFANAEKARDTSQRFIPRFIFSASEASIVNRKLQQIRARLNSRGSGWTSTLQSGP